MAERTFYEVFKENMDLFPLPAPKTIYESFGAGMAFIGALSRTVAMGDKPIGQIFLAASSVGAAASGAAAASEVITGIMLMGGATYVGLVAGCMVEAAWEVHGVEATHQIARLLAGVATGVGPIDVLLMQIPRTYPQAARHVPRLLHTIRISSGAVPRLGGTARRVR